MTSLIFRTTPGGVAIAKNTSKNLGVVDVANFSRIRIVADERMGTGSIAHIRLSLMETSEIIGVLDEIVLNPHSQATKVYDIPGVKVSVDVVSVTGPGSVTLDVFIYGA